ncbi:hypothetical protein ALC60_03748 [Trachymyrmex zeteki]|uniref:Uncharacterized protein n=1 Tax=Mycetomoellerius zeteki TaxID=64791 RepID=A0A151XA24_9HYME|nr:hypothetical protein ALC60_03748 [Trachymyrmex zeteki]
MHLEHFRVSKIDSSHRDGIVQRLPRLRSVKFEESPRCGRETRPAGDDERDTSSDGRGIHGLMGEKAPEAESQGREGGRGGKENDKRGVRSNETECCVSVCERNGLQKPKLQDVQLPSSSRVDERRDCRRRQRKVHPRASQGFYPFFFRGSRPTQARKGA